MTEVAKLPKTSSDVTELPSAAQVQERLLQAPFHRWLNLKVESLSKEKIVLRATGRTERFHSDDHPVVHGGIIAALLDIAADWALLGYGITPSPTIDQTVNYLRPALDLELTVVGRVIKPGRTISIAEASVFAGGKEVAISRASYATVGNVPLGKPTANRQPSRVQGGGDAA